MGTFGRSAEPSALVDRECEFGLGATNKIIIYINAVVIVIAVAVAVAVYVNIIVVYFLVNFTFVVIVIQTNITIKQQLLRLNY